MVAPATSDTTMTIKNNRRLAADAILLGYDDTDVGTVITNGTANGYRTSQAVVSVSNGGIVGSVNR